MSATRETGRILPKDEGAAYLKVAKAITKAHLDSLSIADVKLVRTDAPQLVATKFALTTQPKSLLRAHFRDNVFNCLRERDARNACGVTKV